ncbi:MAG: type I methionyl aminopeptidase [Bacteroidetes bacterium]|nr:type I methionyl aminopeptidase [Bacteroidota bacterium]
MIYKTSEEIELIRKSCLLVCKVLAQVGETIKPGMTGEELDKNAEELIRSHGAEPGFKGYQGFPSTLCISVNSEVVHGIPSLREFQEGDVVSVDCGTFMNGFYGDAAYTFALGDVDEAVMELLRVTNESLYRAIDMAVAGKRLGDIGFAVQNYTERVHNYSVVRELVGHGLGKSLHEAPEVPNYGRRGRGPKLQEGLVIAIEPMINLGKRDVNTHQDGWTVLTKDMKPSAHYEHTVAVQKNKADILSDHIIVEEAIERNSDVKSIAKKLALG